MPEDYQRELAVLRQVMTQMYALPLEERIDYIAELVAISGMSPEECQHGVEVMMRFAGLWEQQPDDDG